MCDKIIRKLCRIDSRPAVPIVDFAASLCYIYLNFNAIRRGLKAKRRTPMEPQIISKQEVIPPFDPNMVAIKHIEYYPYGRSYSEDEITPRLISKLLKQIPKGIGVYLSLNPDGECDWLEVVSDGKWLFLGYCFARFEMTKEGKIVRYDNYYSYNSNFADTVGRIDEADFSDKSVYAPINSGGQSPIPKFQAITDMVAGAKAVEYFIRTGKRYPGIDWAH